MSSRASHFWIGVHVALTLGALFCVTHLKSDVRPHVFLGDRDPVRVAYDEFTRTFGQEAFVVVTCRGDGSPAFQADVGALAKALHAIPGCGPVEIPRPGSPLARELALRDTAGTRVSLLVPLDGTGDRVQAAVSGVCARFPALAPALAGQPVLNDALQDASDRVGRTLFPLLALAMAVLLWLAYRDVRVVGAVFATTVCTLLYGMAIVALLDRPVNLITILLPVLLLALTVALCLHLVNSFRLHRAEGRRIESTLRAMVRDEWRPCLVTTLTTATGFGSFAFSRIEPLRVLGIAMAVSILLALACAFTLLPALLRRLRPRPRHGLNLGPILVRWIPRMVAAPRRVLAGSALLVAVALVAAPRVARETNGLHYLPANHPLRVESARLRDEGVGTASLELVVHAGGNPLAALAAPLRKIGDEVRALGDPVRGVVSPLTFGDEAAWRLGLPATAGALALGTDGGPLGRPLRAFLDRKAGLARVSLRIDPVDDRTYEALRTRVDAIARDVLRSDPGARAEWSGEYPIIMTVQSELLRTLLESLAISSLVILAVLALAHRSLGRAALTLAPALLPLGFVVIACVVTGVPLSIATVMVLAVTLGIVTDDSVHMLHALEKEPLEPALRRVGTAITETSVAIFLGFAVLGGADFLPTREFGLLTAGAMIVALGADLVLFPVVLQGAQRRRVRRATRRRVAVRAPHEVLS